MKVDMDSPKVLERTAKAQSTAVEMLRAELKAAGDPRKVVDEAITKADLLGGLKALRAQGAGG